MRFGQTHPLRYAKGKIAAGMLLLLFGIVALATAFSRGEDTFSVLCCAGMIVLGGVIAAFGVRQDRREKAELRRSVEKKEP